MRRLPWGMILALLVGFGLGLGYAWVIAPVHVENADPAALRPDFKDRYRAAIAAAYTANGNLARAEARLALLKDADEVEALNAQAQRLLAAADPSQQADQLAALALALESGPGSSTNPVTVTPGAMLSPIPPNSSILLTETASPIASEEQPAPVIPTPRPAQTSAPTRDVPFRLTGQDEVCDANLSESLLQVIVLSSNRRQMPGIKIVLTWDGGEEQFFTGLKPDLDNGYADYIMTPDITYTVQLAAGSEIASDVRAPACQSSSGEDFYGGIKLTFQQP